MRGEIVMSVFGEFKWRGMVYDYTDGLEQVFSAENVSAYVGFDPSAASLHVGSLLPVMALARLQKHGHRPIAIVGGGTGLIGDPSGKSLERNLLTNEQVKHNLDSIREQLKRFLTFDGKHNSATIINNADWLTTIPMMDFLRDIGKQFTVNYMLSKESVSRRFEQEQGISFTEFAYMLLQAYDYLELYDKHKCTVQMGGSDQWGNILAGIELIRRVRKAKVHGLVFPLVTSSTGVKFGKTESGAVWLDEKLTSPFRFYQFWLNTDDRDVINYLRYFTWLTEDKVSGLDESVKLTPERREAQLELAQQMTVTVHGETAFYRARHASRILFGEIIDDTTAEELLDIFNDVPSTDLDKSSLQVPGYPLIDMLVLSKLASSRSEARRLIQGGGIYLNNLRVNSEQYSVTIEGTIDGQLCVLRRGRKHYHIVKMVGSG
jgi:tyrosyl-tRNA synthetase